MLAENTSIVDFELVTKPQKMRIEGCPGSLDAVDAAGRVNRAKRMSIVGSKVEPTELVDCRRRRANPMQKDGARGEMIAVRVQRRQPRARVVRWERHCNTARIGTAKVDHR